MSERPPIPNDVMRHLRQEAGFGCCECGHPFIEYHHIIPFSEDKHNRPEDMMVLCANHHHLCTVGAITEIEQRRIKGRPRNIIDNLLQLYVTSRELCVELAGGRAINTPNLLTYRGQTHILRAELGDEGRVLISAIIQDSSGVEIARIIRNEWIARPEQIWDFEVSPRIATVRAAPRHISFESDCRNNQVKLKGNWFLNGMNISFSDDRCTIGSNIIQGMTVKDCGGFISIG